MYFYLLYRFSGIIKKDAEHWATLLVFLIQAMVVMNFLRVAIIHIYGTEKYLDMIRQDDLFIIPLTLVLAIIAILDVYAFKRKKQLRVFERWANESKLIIGVKVTLFLVINLLAILYMDAAFQLIRVAE